MERTHEDLKGLVARVAGATRADLIVLPETICRTFDEEVPGPRHLIETDFGPVGGLICFDLS